MIPIVLNSGIAESNKEDAINFSEEKNQTQQEKFGISSKNAGVAQSVNEITSNVDHSSSLDKDKEDRALETGLMVSTENQSLSLEVNKYKTSFISLSNES